MALRALTPDEKTFLATQGVDVNSLPDQIDVTEPSDTSDATGGMGSAIGATLKAHAGGYVGGGLGTAGGMALGVGLAPETGGLSLLLPLLLGVGGGAAGSYAGEKAQEAVLPTDVEQRLQEQAAAYHSKYPITTTATDVTAGALASGGRPSLRAPVYAAKGLNEFLTGAAATPEYSKALANIAIGGGLNTGISAGTQLATTGKIDPLETLGAAAGGTLFSEPSRLGTRLNPHWTPLEKVVGSSTIEEEAGTLDGGDISNPITIAEKTARDNDLATAAGVESDNQQRTLEFERQQQQELQQRLASIDKANQWRTDNADAITSPSTYKADDIGDGIFRKMYVKQMTTPLGDIEDPTERAVAQQNNAALKNVPIGQMRKEIFEQDFEKNDPNGYQAYQEVKAEKLQKMQETVDWQNRQQEMAGERSRQRAADFERANAERQQQEQQVRDEQTKMAEEQRQQQLAAEEISRRQTSSQTIKQPAQPNVPIEYHGKPINENQRRLIAQTPIPMAENNIERPEIRPTNLVHPNQPELPAPTSAEAAAADVEHGLYGGDRSLYQPTGEPVETTGTPSTPEALREASKNKLRVMRLGADEPIVHPEGGEAAGVNLIKKRLVVLSRMSQGDTLYHETLHQLLADMSNSTPEMQVLAEKFRMGNEEESVQVAGKEYQQRIEGNKTLGGRFSNWLKDVYAATATRLGSENPANLRRRMTSMATRRTSNAIEPMQSSVGGVTPKFQNQDDAKLYKELDAKRMSMMKDGSYLLPDGSNFTPEYKKLWQDIEDVKNRNEGYVPEEGIKHQKAWADMSPEEQQELADKHTEAFNARKEHDVNPNNESGNKLIDAELALKDKEGVKYQKANLTKEDATEVEHKLGVLADSDDLLEDYGLTKEQGEELLKTIPKNGGEWNIPDWAKSAVNGEMQDHVKVLRDIASDANGSNERGQALRINKQAKRLESMFSDETKYQKSNADKERYFTPTQSAISRIRTSVPNETGNRLADAFHTTLSTVENMYGRFANAMLGYRRQLTSDQANRVDKILYWERLNQKPAPPNMFKSPIEKTAYTTIRKSLREMQENQIRIGEPVYRNGKATEAKIDPFYYPTTVEPKISDVYKQNQDKARIAELNAAFLKHQTSLGIEPDKATRNLKLLTTAMQGSAERSTTSNMNYYNAARQAEGIALPDEFRRQDLWRNLEAYTRRKITDNAWYENIESKPKVAASLGYTKDAWGNPINEDVDNLSSNTAVKNIVNEFKGELTDNTSRAEHAIETTATAAMLGPLTEVHKLVSTISQSMSQFSNPLEAAKGLYHAITSIGDSWKHALEQGGVQLSSKSAFDFFNTHLTGAERIQGLAKGIREIYTIHGLTEKVTRGLSQGFGEYLVPSKIAAANAGDSQSVRWMKFLDPSYVKGKTYGDADVQRLGNEFSNMLQGTRDARTLPSWMLATNEVSSFFKLASWNITQTNNFMRNVYTPAANGNFAPLVMSMFGATLGGAVIKHLREQVSDKKSVIPSLEEMEASDRGISGNIPALAYNWMAMASFAGFGGILSNVAKYPFDMKFKNIPQGATFPLDQYVTSISSIAYNAAEALMNDPNANIIDVAARAGRDLITKNVQLARIANNWASDIGIEGQEAQMKKQYSDKTSQLRRFQQVEGLPFDDQSTQEGNPYMNLEQQQFKHEQDLGAAIHELPELIGNIITNYGDKPDVMMEKFRALKSMDYETMPNMEHTPMAFMRYLRFLKNRDGDEAASAAMMDYVKHNAINQAKASMVP